MKKIIIIGAVALGVIGIGVLLSLPDKKQSDVAAKDNKTDQPAAGQEFPNLGQKHIQHGEAHDPYNSNPPTSGPHWIDPAEWGIYSTPLVDEQAVHNLEHGGIWISYKGIDDETKAKLETIAKANPGSVIMSPRDTDESKIVLAAWTRLESLDSYDETKILDFIKANKNKSPEPLAK